MAERHSVHKQMPSRRIRGQHLLVVSTRELRVIQTALNDMVARNNKGNLRRDAAFIVKDISSNEDEET